MIDVANLQEVASVDTKVVAAFDALKYLKFVTIGIGRDTHAVNIRLVRLAFVFHHSSLGLVVGG